MLRVIITAISQLECRDGRISKQYYTRKMIGQLRSPKWASSKQDTNVRHLAQTLYLFLHSSKNLNKEAPIVHYLVW